MQVIELIGKARPELLLEAQHKIESFLEPGSKVLEFGSGHSTVWFAEMGCEVVSVENNEDWLLAVHIWLAERDLQAEIHLRSPEQLYTVAAGYQNNYFDLVLVDGAHGQHRMDCLRASKDKIRTGGWAVIDDSHWGHCKAAPKILKGWTRADISGLHLRHSGISKKTKTSFYRRPSDS